VTRGAPGLRLAHVEASGGGGIAREGVGEHGGRREQRRRDRWTSVEEKVVVGCHDRLQEEETEGGQPWVVYL